MFWKEVGTSSVLNIESPYDLAIILLCTNPTSLLGTHPIILLGIENRPQTDNMYTNVHTALLTVSKR